MTLFTPRIRKLFLASVAAISVVPAVASAGGRWDRDDHRDRGRRYDNSHHDNHNDVNFRIDLNFGRNPACEPRRVWVEPVYRTVCDRVWVEPVYQTVCDRVWREPVFEDRCEKVWVPAVYESRRVKYWDGRCWRVRDERVCVAPGHFEVHKTRVLVREGGWENVERRVCVTEGHWTTVERRECVTEGHWEYANAGRGYDSRIGLSW